MSKKLSVSILDANFARLASQIKLLEEAGVEMFHLDVMDGHFVPRITFGPKIIEGIAELTSLPLDVHLMIENPERYIDEFIKVNPSVITIHYETHPPVKELSQVLKKKNISLGLAFNPKTPITPLENFLDEVKVVLIMSVEPGAGGQGFIPEVFQKIKEAKEIIRESPHPVELEVDGGVKEGNINQILSAGADILVVGTAVFHSQNIKESFQKLQKILKNNDGTAFFSSP